MTKVSNYLIIQGFLTALVYFIMLILSKFHSLHAFLPTLSVLCKLNSQTVHPMTGS